MSALRDIPLEPIIHRNGTKIFFETGTGLGSGLMRMIQPEYGFNMLISCDIDKDLASHSKKSFSFDQRVNVFHEEGPAVLRNILPQLPLNVPILYWLDSHFQNADYNLGDNPLVTHTDSGVPDVRLPAWNEIKLIKELRIDRGARDVIMLDDVMLYDDQDRYEDSIARLDKAKPGSVPPEYRQILRRTLELLGPTHKHTLHTIAQGLLVLEPR
jgi:hypothetical protein